MITKTVSVQARNIYLISQRNNFIWWTFESL